MANKRKRPQRAPGESPWYKATDLMRLFDCSERCVWTWVSKKMLPEPVRRGTRWTRWPRHEIDGLLVEWGRRPGK